MKDFEQKITAPCGDLLFKISSVWDQNWIWRLHLKLLFWLAMVLGPK
jgi:hypothetical protein